MLIGMGADLSLRTVPPSRGTGDMDHSFRDPDSSRISSAAGGGEKTSHTHALTALDIAKNAITRKSLAQYAHAHPGMLDPISRTLKLICAFAQPGMLNPMSRTPKGLILR
jgi:hypothetical protein